MDHTYPPIPIESVDPVVLSVHDLANDMQLARRRIVRLPSPSRTLRYNGGFEAASHRRRINNNISNVNNNLSDTTTALNGVGR